MTAQNITLTPVSPGVTEYIQATQGENNARSLTFRVLDAIGQPLDLTGCTVAFYVDRRESGVVQIAAVLTGDNAAQVTLPSGACNIPGEWGCWVQVIKPEVFDLRADNLILRVQPCNIDHAGEASDEFGLLTQLITQAQEAIENANNAAEEAAATAESTATTVATNIINQQKSQPNGLATLNSSGKLAQMPTAADVGAVPVSRTVNGKALSSNITLTAADVGAVPLASIAVPNLLLNSDFGVNQRGETSYSKGRYTADRWYNSSAGTVTIAASTLPNGTAKNMLVISQQASQNTVSQPMENLDSVLGQELTACFWAKAAKAGQMRVGIANDIDTVLNVTTAWKKFTVSLNPTARNSSIWTVDGLFFQSAVSSAALGTLYIAEPQLVYGSFAGVYTPPNPAEELVKCQRYYQRLYDASSNDVRFLAPAVVSGSGTWIAMASCMFPVVMREKPKMTYHLGSGVSTAGLAATKYGIDINKSGFEEGEAFVLKYEADAEIYS